MRSYVFRRGEYFYYRRRVPGHVLPYETRTSIKISLGTTDEREAHRKASIYNDYIEDFWRSLIKANGQADRDAAYRAAVKLAKAHGFAYKSVAEIAKAPLEEIIERVRTAAGAIEQPQIVASVLGGADAPRLMLGECLEKFWPLCADRLVNKSDHQIRKWKNPRIAALGGFMDVVGDKKLSEVSRGDILKYRQYWMDRVADETAVAGTVNKNMQYVRDILQAVCAAQEIETDIDAAFARTRLKEVDKSRPPFEARFVQETLLSGNALSGLNTEARLLIFAMADTGARESELIGLKPDDILLEDTIPYIWVRARNDHALKTLHSERKIPLVGASLYAFAQLPHGFTHYRNADTASSTINKFLRENKLKPTDAHTLYSLRHTFKDRLRDAGAPEEVIDELMGHRSRGPKYGRGHMLETKHEWLKKIAFHILQ
ncbi:MAG: tyrosine-type recombinase/integrase [Alphaproteobacteria bacterium]|nr:tyrosine-type recombinase/integrase [Alphaproteobacteria bacterium]